MPFRLGPTEIIIVLVIVLLIFGIGKLPQAGSALGKTMKAFKTGQADDSDEVEEEEKKPRRKIKRKTS
ncbi:MAG: twin-arginine translocase TatA/TatE family subunit [Dehalococcoidia bacterium]|nr:twin-arginine translocase TatA/TatE family subunit [Dehalococcoidia bacterium]